VIPSPTDARFSPEYSKTYEVGLKSEWLDHRLLVNTALYYTNYDGIQLNIQQGISPVYTNAGDAKIKGAELDVSWLVGAGLKLNVAADYIDAYYTSVNANANIPESALPDGTTICPATAIINNPPPPHPICGISPPGLTQTDAKLPKTPKYKIAFFPQYDYYLASKADVRLMAAFTYTADLYNDSLNTPQLWRPATRNLDASIHYISPEAMYDLSFGGSNLTNDRYVTAGSPNYGAGEVGGYYNPPRMWYASIRVNFKP
jgi:iron complex outermembrane receptor protein